MDIYINKCPNCGCKLKYNADTHIYHCIHCTSDYTADELKEKNKEIDEALKKESIENDTKDLEHSPVIYKCSNCGAEIITDEDTIINFCYYCNSPITLGGRFLEDLEPDYIIPFKISKEEAEDKFYKLIKGKMFLPKTFVNSIDKLSGVYFPYWFTDCKVSGRYSADGKNVKSWIADGLDYTEIRVYDIRRSGIIEFNNINNFAIKGGKTNFIAAVQPFNEKEMINFNIEHLSGFMAEKGNITLEEISNKTKNQVSQYTKRLLEESIGEYDRITHKKVSSEVISSKYEYVLLPVWVFTYTMGGKTYYYALNGQTGKAVANLPACRIKLSLLVIGVFLLCLIIVVMIGGIILW